MLKIVGTVRAVAGMISDAAEGAIRSYKEGLVSDEPQITDRMLGAIQDRFREGIDARDRPTDTPAKSSKTLQEDFEVRAPRPRGVGNRRIIWRAKTLRTGRGIAAEEQKHGADLMGVLDLDFDGFRTKKGFLVQAKRAEPGTNFSRDEWDRLVAQCNLMLDRTPDAYVFAYSKSMGVRIFPAVSVAAYGGRCLFDLYDRSIQSFFEAHIECFIGDRRLHSPKIEVLDALVGYEVNRVLYLRGETVT